MKKIGLILAFLFVASIGVKLAVNNSAQPMQKQIRLATTTSTYHSGLLNYLINEFTKDSGIAIDVIASGTGKALKMGENGDVDLVITHAPQAEALFVEKGYGVLPRKLMYNDFIIVGPKSDPAKIKDNNNVFEALNHIANSNALFVSRGDDSGTHKKENSLWKQVEKIPEFSNYQSVGQGMGSTLTMASEMQAYTLSDRGTWLAYQNKLDLVIFSQGEKALFNPYQVILVNPKRYPNIEYQAAKTFSDWLISPKGQELINSFRLNGEALFVADADNE